MKNKRKRYAFIDVQNTASTAQKLLGFIVDWHKLYNYLKNQWDCEEVYFYSGVDEGDDETFREFDVLSGKGCIIRSKIVFSYKIPNKKISIKCVGCGKDNVEVVDMGYNKKSNCDVDLTVDAMEIAGHGKEFIIFTGDGDFEYLIRKVVEKGVKVRIVSSNRKIKRGLIYVKRFSKKLKDLINKNKSNVDLIDINSWKFRIKKEE